MGMALRKWSVRQVVNKGLGAFVHWVSLNAVAVEDGVVMKRRNAFGVRMTAAANWFLRASNAPLVFWKEVGAWQRWEVTCYRLLYPRYEAMPVGRNSVRLERLPGESMFEILKRGAVLNAEEVRTADRRLI